MLLQTLPCKWRETIARPCRVGSLLLSVLLIHAKTAEPQTAPNKRSPDPDARKLLTQNRHLVTQAYKATQDAQTVDDFANVISLCEQAMLGELPEKLLQYTKDLLSWTHNKRGEIYARQANDAAEQGNMETAVDMDSRATKDFESSISLDSKRWRAIHNRGVSYAILGEFDQAIEDFNRTIELRPNFSKAWFNRGEVGYEQEDFEGAVHDYTESIRLNPEDPGAYSGRAHSHYRMSRYREALADYDQALEFGEKDALAYTDRGDAHHRLGHWQRAASDYRRAIKLDEGSGRAYQGAAWLMATCPDKRYRNHERSLQAAQKAIELDGDEDHRYLDTLAAAQAANENYEEAISEIEQAIELAPENETGKLRDRLKLYQEEKPYRQASRPRRTTRR